MAVAVQRTPQPRIWTRPPYTVVEWRTIRSGWWWHLVASVVLFPFWAMVAWTIWQKPVGAWLPGGWFIGCHDHRRPPADSSCCCYSLDAPVVLVLANRSVPESQCGPERGLGLGVGSVSSKSSKASHTPAARATTPPMSNPAGQPFRDPLATPGERRVRIAGPIQRLAATDAARARTSASHGRRRVRRRCRRQLLPSGDAGQMIQDGIGNRPSSSSQRLQTAEQEALSPDASPAIVATIKSLRSESASLQRMRTTVTELHAELERLCAQLSALVTRGFGDDLDHTEQAGHSRLTDAVPSVACSTTSTTCKGRSTLSEILADKRRHHKPP